MKIQNVLSKNIRKMQPQDQATMRSNLLKVAKTLIPKNAMHLDLKLSGFSSKRRKRTALDSTIKVVNSQFKKEESGTVAF